jgi:hypothetical protein
MKLSDYLAEDEMLVFICRVDDAKDTEYALPLMWLDMDHLVVMSPRKIVYYWIFKRADWR